MDVRLTEVTSRSEREAALDIVIELPVMKRRTLGSDKARDARGLVRSLRALNTTPRIACKSASYSMMDQRTTRHSGHEASWKRRERVEEIFGWLKTVGLMR